MEASYPVAVYKSSSIICRADDGGSVFGWNSFEFMGDVGSLFADQTEPFHPLAFLSVRLQGRKNISGVPMGYTAAGNWIYRDHCGSTTPWK